MPALETYGAQPPIELLRQWMDHRGWYDRKQIGTFKQLVDINFACAMGPPGGGRNPITSRFSRHFNYLSFTEMEDSSKLKIFSTILGSWMVSHNRDLDITHDLLSGALQIVRVIEEYMEDFNQISTTKMKLVLFMDAIQHVCRISRILRQPLGNALLLGVGGSGRQSLTKLASHMAEYECFQIELAKNYGMSEWREDIKGIMLKAGMQNAQITFLFVDTQIKNESFLEDINNILNSGDVPNLYALDEQDQIMAAMKPTVQDQGQQPTKSNLLAAYIKRVRSNIHTVLCMSNTGEYISIKNESFLEDINNILNSGDVPNLYAPDEQDQIMAAMKPTVQDQGQQPTKSNLLAAYIKRVRSNIHTVLCMSPIGEVFRARLRQFPSLVTCCTIDWFNEWPSEALESVASSVLQEIPALESSPAVTEGLIHMCVEIHQMVARKSKQYLAELSRHNYITPKSYLELLSIFSKLIGMKKSELKSAKQRMKTGLDKLLRTAEDVAKMQEELEEMGPLLEEAAKDTIVTMEKIKVRAMQRPPQGVKLVIEAVCIMKGVKPKKIAGEKPGTKVDDYWEPGKGLLQDPGKFLEGLFKFDKDNIGDAIIKTVQPYIDNEEFQPAAIAKVSKACTSICQWVRAMHKYHFIARAVEPKRQALRESQDDLAVTQKILDEAKRRLEEVEGGIAMLQAKYKDCVSKKEELEVKCAQCEQRLVRADKLITGLADEKVRWQDTVCNLEYMVNNVAGDVLLSAGYVAYLGPFTGEYRAAMADEWLKKFDEFGVPHTKEPNLIGTLGEPVKIRSWQISGLPKDNLSVENGVIAQYSQRWCHFIDPQGQANKWIKNMEKDKGIDVIKLSDRDFLRSLENAIRFGKPCLLENVGEELDPALEPVLQRETYKHQGSMVLKLGDAVIPYHHDFKMYITTKLPNPHYSPEISTKVTLINFTLSPSGLEDQLLGRVVAEERPDLEEAKNQLIVSNAKMRQELKEIEDQILFRLSSSEGNPVDDEELIKVLEASKIKAGEIKAKVTVAEQTEKDIDLTRLQYVPVAVRTQILFFCVSDLSNVDPMYQYSLEWFLSIFMAGISNSEGADTVEKRIVNINEYFTFSLYCNVCRSLFEKHKLMFAFLLCVRILMNEGQIDMGEWRYLLSGGTVQNSSPNPAPDWLSERAWQDILALTGLHNFSDLADSFTEHLDEFKGIFDSSEPHASDLSAVFKESSPTTPLIFVLSPGTDPAADLYKFAEEMKFSKKMNAISLGQGQGPRAEALTHEAMERGKWVFFQNCHLAPSWMPSLERLIETIDVDKGPRAEALTHEAMERGKWVFFQNCHLAPSWMPSLERLIETIDVDKVHRDFRLWLTSLPSNKFPVSILQNSSKMTIEPPRGIKANLMKSYSSLSDDFLNSCAKADKFKSLLLSLCFFHGNAIERRKFGPLGFNIPYEFTDGDLRICISQLKMFLDEYSETPYKVLKYTAGEINYGGRVTDDWDRRCILNILEDFYNASVLSEEHVYSKSGIYRQISTAFDLNGYLQYIKSLPINDTPEIFGLHDNANITFAQNETFALLTAVVQLQPRSSASGGRGREEIVEEIVGNILVKIPKPIDVQNVMKKFPVLYEESMNTVLLQEVIRYNRLLKVISQSLNDLLKALKGLVVMSSQLELMSNSLFNNAVPAMWQAKGLGSKHAPC
ncbi:UNVERIFIED_CONTAM: hypothetical protein FKN15_074253 [Acipenser sinensis]